MRVLVLLAPFVVAAGCAQERYGALATTWDQATPSSTSPTSSAAPSTAASAAAPDKGKVTAKEAAAEIRSAGDCMAQARQYYAKDKRAGQSLLAECVHKESFVDLENFLKGPWTKDLATSEPFPVLTAELMAHRGGFVEQDSKLCRTGRARRRHWRSRPGVSKMPTATPTMLFSSSPSSSPPLIL